MAFQGASLPLAGDRLAQRRRERVPGTPIYQLLPDPLRARGTPSAVSSATSRRPTRSGWPASTSARSSRSRSRPRSTRPSRRSSGERRVVVRRSVFLPDGAHRVEGVRRRSDPDSYALDVPLGCPGRGPDEPALPGVGRKGAGHARRRRIPEPPRSVPLLRASATARPRVTAEQLEAALLEEVERVAAAPITAEELGAGQAPAPRRSSSSRRAA